MLSLEWSEAQLGIDGLEHGLDDKKIYSSCRSMERFDRLSTYIFIVYNYYTISDSLSHARKLPLIASWILALQNHLFDTALIL